MTGSRRNRSSDLYRIGPLYVGSVLTVNQAFPSVFGYPTQPLASDDGPSGGPAQLPPSGRTLDWFGPFPIVGVSKRLQRFERRENRLPLESRSTATPPFGGGTGGVRPNRNIEPVPVCSGKVQDLNSAPGFTLPASAQGHGKPGQTGKMVGCVWSDLFFHQGVYSGSPGRRRPDGRL